MEGQGTVVEMILGVKKKHEEKHPEADKDKVTCLFLITGIEVFLQG